jgi:hypothetical protein
MTLSQRELKCFGFGFVLADVPAESNWCFPSEDGQRQRGMD